LTPEGPPAPISAAPRRCQSIRKGSLTWRCGRHPRLRQRPCGLPALLRLTARHPSACGIRSRLARDWALLLRRMCLLFGHGARCSQLGCWRVPLPLLYLSCVLGGSCRDASDPPPNGRMKLTRRARCLLGGRGFSHAPAALGDRPTHPIRHHHHRALAFAGAFSYS